MKSIGKYVGAGLIFLGSLTLGGNDSYGQDTIKTLNEHQIIYKNYRDINQILEEKHNNKGKTRREREEKRIFVEKYGKEGLLIKEKARNIRGGRENEYVIEYIRGKKEYNEEDKIIKKIERINFQGYGKTDLMNVTSYDYNRKGQLTREWLVENETPEQHRHVAHDRKNCLNLPGPYNPKVYQIIGPYPEWIVNNMRIIKYKYDDQGQIIEKKRIDDFAGDNSIDSQTFNYKYDDKGRRIEEKWQLDESDDGINVKTYITKYKYDDKGKRIEIEN